MYVVTGGAGFIGSAVLWKLNQNGVDRILVVDNLGKSDKWKNLVNRRYTDYIHRSVFLDRLEKNEFSHLQGIIHMGACSATTERDADFLMDNNFHYSRRLARYAQKKKIRFINASSAATYGDGGNGFKDRQSQLSSLKPLNMYGYSKHLFDLWAQRNNMLDKLVSLKFFNVFGPNEYHKDDMSSVVFKAFGQIQKTGRISLFKSYKADYADGEQQRDFVYVKDCVGLIWWFLEHPEINGVFNVGSGKARSWNDLARAVFNAMNLPHKITYIPMPDSIKDRYQYFTCAMMSKLENLDYPIKFHTLEQAVQDYISGYLSQNDLYL